jgi:hypothetical protein
MASRKCCCGRGCEWCNHDDPRQVNYKEVTGTVTTEIPSIGHPITSTSVFNSVYYDYYKGKSLLRTLPPPTTSWNRQIWDAPGLAYGDVQPCWFNGINMKNITEDNPYHQFKFVLRIRKKINNNPTGDNIDINSPDYVDVVNLSWNGYGKNIRPHPDACGSFNVTSNLFLTVDNGCGVFGKPNQDDTNPCTVDFAKMPRGPWPYRLKRNFQTDLNNQYCYNSDGIPLSVSQAQAYNKTVPSNKQCPLTEASCKFAQDPDLAPYAQCCASSSDSYCSGSEYCNMLDDEGTPYGWEDCPYGCAQFSLYNKTDDLAQNRRFFCWWNPHNRYTTPEWDVKDFNTGDTRKMSIHVVVPTVKTGVDFCQLSNSTPDQSFSEWSFGMDLEASDEISTLENSGFVFSNGREAKGVWINKTPTNALRVLFTLDHADLEAGRVWRVFNDWDVESEAITWDKNVNTGSEFIVYVEQKLTELAFSSLGCDCPSGGTAQGPQACGYATDPVWGNCVGTPRISFSERGPLAIRFYANTTGSGAYDCLRDVTPDDPTATKISSTTCPGHGTVMIVDSRTEQPLTSATLDYYPNFETFNFNKPYLTKTGDIPGSKGTVYGVDFSRYRGLYTAVEVSPNFINDNNVGNKDLYGSYNCSDKDLNCTDYNFETIYTAAPIILNPFIGSSYIEACSVNKFCDQKPCPSDNTRTPPEDKCVDNLVTQSNRPSNPSYYENCEFSVCRGVGSIEPLCPGPDLGGGFFGIDSDNIYFSANGSEGTIGYLGSLDCWPVCGRTNCDNKSCNQNNCFCNFEEQGGKSYSGGYNDTFVKWRRYYCQLTDTDGNGNTSLIPVDMMGKLYMQCSGSDSCDGDPSTTFCRCSYFFRWGNCSSSSNPEIHAFNDTGNVAAKLYGSYVIYTEKFNELTTDLNFGYFDTNYKTNEVIDVDMRRSGNTITIRQQKTIN